MTLLIDDIQSAINRHSAENVSNTPDYVLAQFLVKALAAFDHATNTRALHMGDHTAPDTRPKQATATAAPSVEPENKQIDDQLAKETPEYVEIRRVHRDVGMDCTDVWVRCKVIGPIAGNEKAFYVRDGMELKAVELGLNCRRADPPAAHDPIEAPDIAASLATMEGIDKAMSAPRITPNDVENEILYETYFTAAQGAKEADGDGGPDELAQVTFCVLVLQNGTKVVGINYGAIDTARHDSGRGKVDARADAIRQVWPLLGYALRDRLAKAKANPIAHHPV